MISRDIVKSLVQSIIISFAFYSVMKLLPFYSGYVQVALFSVVLLVSLRHPKLALILIWLIAVPAMSYYSPGLGLLHLILTIPFFSLTRRHWLAGAIYLISVGIGITEQFMGQFVASALIASAIFFDPVTACMLGLMYSLTVFSLLTWIFPAGIINRGFILSQAYGLVTYPRPIPENFDIAQYLAPVFSSQAVKEASSMLQCLYFNLLSYGMMPLSLLIAYTVAPYGLASLAGKNYSRIRIALTSLLVSSIIALIFSSTLNVMFAQPIDFDFYLPFILMTTSFSIAFGSIAGIVNRFREEEKFSTTLSEIGLFTPSKRQKVRFEDIGGLDNIKFELQESILLPLEKAKLAKEFNLSIPKGILLFGPPGCGKTLLMKALASRLKMKFIHVKCSDIMSKWYGESEQKLAKIFALARREAPCILFFDEIDAIARKRDSYSTDDVAPRLLSIILSEMDEIFRIHCRGLPLAKGVDFAILAEMTERFSGADIAAVVREAARRAARDSIKGRKRLIGLGDFIAVIRRFKPSITYEMLEKYEKFRMDYERVKTTAHRESLISPVRLDDIVDLEYAKSEILDSIIIPLKHPELLEKYNIRQPRGILLFGPPGCGKTMLARAVANELQVQFIEVQCSEITVGDNPEQNVKKIFARARENAPAIIFLDEIDALVPSRSESSEKTRRLLAQFLVEMDGIRNLKNVVILAATNKPSSMDPALLRPGRFDKILYIPPPTKAARMELFKKELENVAIKNLDYERLAELTQGFSAADIVYICNEAKMRAAKRSLQGGDPEVTYADLVTVIESTSPSITDDMMAECYEFYLKHRRSIQLSIPYKIEKGDNDS
ncbi:MAG: hypothetical protein B6U95_04905 [Thermofilum sp. ex4484_82]|nr:MAG: hypothetical protein B6U95_04905 [Thermofilum sp. ex4484_82]OYT38229.1 MAG: hypothetical protein B6U96_04900 [Archaeoglobales archaeon ex4484_92]